MKVYAELYSIAEFRPVFERMFAERYLYRHMMLSRSETTAKKNHSRKISVFEEAFKLREFDHINWGFIRVISFKSKWDSDIYSFIYKLIIIDSIWAFLGWEPSRLAWQRWRRPTFHLYLDLCNRCSSIFSWAADPSFFQLWCPGTQSTPARRWKFWSDCQTSPWSIFCIWRRHVVFHKTKHRYYRLRSR